MITRNILIIFLAFSLVYIQCCYAQIHDPNSNVRLVLKTDKLTYRVGDNMSIIFILANDGNQALRILPWGGEYTTNWIHIYGSTGAPVRKIKKVIYELKAMAESQDYITIQPKEAFSIPLTGRFYFGTNTDIANNERVKGLFLDFNNSAFLFPALGTYCIKVSYVGREEWKTDGLAAFGFTNIWTGSVDSQLIEIELGNK